MSLRPPESCFGKSWMTIPTLCDGGLDPTYVNPSNGSNRRDKCGWFSQCASRTNASRMGNQPQQIVPREQLVQRHQQVAQPTSPWAPFRQAASTIMSRAAGMQPAPQQVLAPQQQQMYYQQQQMMPNQMVHPSVAMMPYAVPMNHQMPGAQMPGYLTTPEPVLENQHWLTRLMLNVARSMGKASGHTVANFFDHNTINRWPSPPPTELNK